MYPTETLQERQPEGAPHKLFFRGSPRIRVHPGHLAEEDSSMLEPTWTILGRPGPRSGP